MKTTLLITLAILGISSLSACNTANGFGKDLESAGRGIQNGAG